MNQLCPDRQLLSVYCDGEMPSPWKEKMESHIAGCPSCAGQLKLHRQVSIRPSADEAAAITAAMEAAKERVWQKLEPALQGAQFPAAVPQSGAIWRRRVSVPIPAAAAIFLLIALAFLLVMRTTMAPEKQGMLLAAENDFDTTGIIPVADMEDVLQYLGSRDNGELIILRLPESRSFSDYSEPAIIRAADYSRSGQQMPGRHMQGGRGR